MVLTLQVAKLLKLKVKAVIKVNTEEMNISSPVTDTTVVCSGWFGHDAFFAD